MKYFIIKDYRLNETFRAHHVAEGVADVERQAFMITAVDLRIFTLWLTKGF